MIYKLKFQKKCVYIINTIMNCDQQTTLAMIACILLIAFLDVFDKNIPQLQQLFTNKTNMLLVALLGVLVIFVNIPVGIMLLVVLSYMHYYYNEKANRLKRSRENMINLSMSRMSNNFLDKTGEPTHVQSDVNVNNVNQTAKNNTFEQLKKKVSFDIKAVVDKRTSDYNLFDNEGKDMLTQVAPNNRQGFDVSGCRYDMKVSGQNLNKHGPPLALCSVYCGDKNQKVGTNFYPLNG
jgi:uncharacterized membrane protein YidH (DUF202 family)